MKKRNKKILIIIFSLLLIIFLEPIVNVFSYLSINDKEEVEKFVLESENLKLKTELEKIEELYAIKSEEQEIIYSKVVLRNIYDFYKEITIDKGERDGIKKGSAVVNGYGLIGIVDQVLESRSVVKLISNPEINISVKINDGYGNFNNYVVDKVDEHLKVSVGDKIYTSGLTDIVGGILVGEVKEIVNNNLEIEKELIVRNDLILKEINYVGVIQK